MVGVRRFNKEDALNAALKAFWLKGYDAVSIPDLEEVTGVRRQSLYLAFGDKKTIFLQALQQYADRYIGGAVSKLRLSEPLDGLTSMFTILFERMENRDNPDGCLITNATLEAGAGDRDVQVQVERYLRQFKEALQDSVARGQEQGTITQDMTAEELALWLLAVTRGLSVMHRAGFAMGELKLIRETTLRQLTA